MRTVRVEAFSDGVFAIAITLLVLEIRVPEDMSDLRGSLLRLWPSYLAYSISFLLIGLVWANHHAMFDVIAHADRALLFINTLLLANVASLPFTTAVMASAIGKGQSQNIAVALYGGWLVVGGIFFNVLWWWARRDHHLLHKDFLRADASALARRFVVGPVAYGCGTLLAFVWWQGALSVFAALIVFYWLPVTRHR